MTLGQILNDIQVGNELTEEELLNMEVVRDLQDTTGTFRGTGTAVHSATVNIKTIWSCMNGKRMPDPKGKPRIVLSSVIAS
jgi:hypothetical protein